MVCELGMSEKLGPLTFGKKEEMVFLGKEIATHKDYSEETALAIDGEVRQIAETCYQRAFQLLKDNEDRLHLLARTLLEREVLDGDEMNRLLRGEKLDPLTPVEPPTAHPVVTEVIEPKPSGIEAFTPPPRPRPAGA
jgi:cell division protease FtsH